MPRSLRPAMTVVRRYWSLTRARYDESATAPPLGPPLPSGPWQAAHAVAYTACPRAASPAAAAYVGKPVTPPCADLPHLSNMSDTSASICASVRVPPAAAPKAG